MSIKNKVNEALISIAHKSYIGSVLQCLKIIPDPSIPTAGVAFDKKTKSILMLYSPKFLDELTFPQLKAVLIHEVDHILRKHIYIYNEMKQKRSDAKRLNFAMDLVINQKLPELPKGALFIEHFKDKAGNPFPAGESTETYYDLLEDADYDNPDMKDGEGNPMGPQEFDQHYWDEFDKNEVLEATKELLKRAQYVFQKSHSGAESGELKDMLNEITKIQTDINYKRLLLSTLRNAIPSKDIKKTWTRPSRRFGLLAKGSKIKEAPSVSIYCDTSGSIGYEELNSSLGVITDIIKQGVSKINLHLFHHKLYHSQVFKKGAKFAENDLQSGGTELEEVVAKMKDSQDEIHIVLTDGHYGTNNWDKSLNSKKVVFLIRNGGNLEHPLKGLGKTVEYKNV